MRESLEDSTMAMAQSLADPYTEIRNLDGSPVECGLLDTNIGGGKKHACEERFSARAPASA